MLACHEVTAAINALCDGHFYREAWVTAKVYKYEEDTMCLHDVATKWIDYLVAEGKFDVAAVM